MDQFNRYDKIIVINKNLNKKVVFNKICQVINISRRLCMAYQMDVYLKMCSNK